MHIGRVTIGCWLRIEPALVNPANRRRGARDAMGCGRDAARANTQRLTRHEMTPRIALEACSPDLVAHDFRVLPQNAVAVSCRAFGWQRVSSSSSEMIPDCRFARWPIGRQAAPSSVNYQQQHACGGRDAERGQQSTPPTTNRRVHPGQNNSAAEYDRKLALWEAAPVPSPAFRPRLPPRWPNAAVSAAPMGKIECAWNTGRNKGDGREAPKRANCSGWAVASECRQRHRASDAFGESRCPYSATGQPCSLCSASTPQ